MGKALVTGATGLVGFNIVEALRRRRAEIRCLVRSPDLAREILGRDVEYARGDLTDAASIRRAMDGCSTIYHAAGLPEQWLADQSAFQRLNVAGTGHVIAAALEVGVERFVFTSTVDVFAASSGRHVDETAIDAEPKPTAYQRSKQDADRLVAAALDRGLPAVFIHPAAVYGPGPLTSRGMNQFFAELRARKIPLLLPGGLAIVYGPDVGEGHVLAAERADVGERFILSESYRSLMEIAQELAAAVGLKKIPPVLPLWAGRLVSEVGERVSKLTKRPPLIPKGQLRLLQSGAKPSAKRATDRLDWPVTPFAEGLRRTLAYLDGAK